MNFICLAPGCTNRAEIHLVQGVGPVGNAAYGGDSFCSIGCLVEFLAENADEMRRIYR